MRQKIMTAPVRKAPKKLKSGGNHISQIMSEMGSR